VDSRARSGAARLQHGDVASVGHDEKQVLRRNSRSRMLLIGIPRVLPPRFIYLSAIADILFEVSVKIETLCCWAFEEHLCHPGRFGFFHASPKGSSRGLWVAKS
jgi:hypothetical protein